MKRSIRILHLAALAAGAAILFGCAPAGFVESTANVLDEMSAFRLARKQNTRSGWEAFVRQYPDSSKAQAAQQWIAMMPEGGQDSAARSEMLQAEAERRTREAAVKQAAEEAQRRLEEEEQNHRDELTRSEEQARLAKEQAEKQAAQAPEVSTTTLALLNELKRREAELERREADLKAREDKFAAAPVVPAVVSDDIDTPPKGTPANEENFAIVIGVEKYRDIEIPAQFAERDARTVALYLRDTLGYPEQNIKLLTGDRATRSDFAKMIELWLPLQVTPESHVFFYYSGHGAPDPKSQEAYLVPYDGDPKALEMTAYPLQRLYDKLAALPSKDVTVALDSCFSGGGGRSVIAQGARPLMTRLDTGKVKRTDKLTVFAAAAGEEITGSYEPQKHGLFTYYFLRGLRGDADADHDGFITTAEEYAYVKKNVSREANRSSREQTPKLLPDIGEQADAGARKLIKVPR